MNAYSVTIRDCSTVTGADLRVARQGQGESTRDLLHDSELAPQLGEWLDPKSVKLYPVPDHDLGRKTAVPRGNVRRFKSDCVDRAKTAR